MQHCRVAITGIHQIGRIAEFRRFGDGFQGAGLQVSAHNASAEIAAAAMFEDVLQGQRAKVEAQRGFGFFRQGGVVLAAEIRAPVDVDVRLRTLGRAHQNQFFLQHLLDLQTRPVFRLINQRGIEHTEFELTQQIFAIANFHAQCVAGDFLAQFRRPTEHQRVAQADLATDVQNVVITLGQRQVAARGFPGLHQLIGVDHERFAIGRQLRPGAIAHEQRTAQLAFEFLHPRGDGGLRDEQLLRSGGETAVTDDFEESASEVDVHGAGPVSGGGAHCKSKVPLPNLKATTD